MRCHGRSSFFCPPSSPSFRHCVLLFLCAHFFRHSCLRLHSCSPTAYRERKDGKEDGEGEGKNEREDEGEEQYAAFGVRFFCLTFRAVVSTTNIEKRVHRHRLRAPCRHDFVDEVEAAGGKSHGSSCSVESPPSESDKEKSPKAWPLISAMKDSPECEAWKKQVHPSAGNSRPRGPSSTTATVSVAGSSLLL